MNQGELWRDYNLEKVEDNAQPWSEQAYQCMTLLPPGQYTGESIRQIICAKIGPPHHHNAIGALIMRGVRSGILQPTGQWTKMKIISSHARKTPVYKIIIDRSTRPC